jgi:hypothetical protein
MPRRASRSRIPLGPLACGTVLLALLGGGAAAAGCPEPDEIVRRIAALDLAQSSRVARFGATMPETLYAKAARRVGEPLVTRGDKRGFGVLVSDLTVEQWWQAINDENRHAGYVPVGHSEIVAGTPRSAERWLFQYARAFGLGRYWVSRVRMNAELFRTSQGRLWELWWIEDLAAADPGKPPLNEVSSKNEPMELTRGSWLLAPLGEGCMLVELFSWYRAGGAVGALEGLAAGRSLRETLAGLARLAGEMEAEIPPLDPPFVRPDGTPFAAAPTAGPAQ